MRIDVRLSVSDVDSELVQLDARFSGAQSGLHGIPALPSPLPGLSLRYRECHGEFFLYVQDTARQRLAGYTVFSHVAGLGAQAGRGLRTPHSRYGAGYQRRGIATAVYQWALNAGICLVSGPRQSAGAHALWQSLSARYALAYVDVSDRTVRHLGAEVHTEVLDDFHTRMLLSATPR